MLSDKNQKLLFIMICGIATAFGFLLLNPLPLYFLNDDFIHIPLSKEGILLQRKSLRPLGDLSLQLDYMLWQKNAVGYHSTNLVLHVINSILVFFLANGIFKKYSSSVIFLKSLAAAVLFFVYAFHSESLFWIIGRSGSLGALFCIPAIIFFLKRNENKFHFILSVLFFSAGLFAYESVWVFPLLAVCLSIADVEKFKTKFKTELIFIGIIFLVFITHLIIKKQLLGEVAGKYEAIDFINFNIGNLVANWAKLIIRCFIPPVNNQIIFILSALVVLVALVFIFFLLVKKMKSISNSLVFIFFIISFLPYLSLGINTHTVEGERYEYLPSIFASLLFVQLIFQATANKIYQLIFLLILFIYNLFYLKKQ